MRPIQRITPALPAQDVKTFSVSSPPSTHLRDATCAEVDCEAYKGGWRTTVDESTDLGSRQAAFIRRTCVAVALAASAAVGLSGTRRYSESASEGLTSFDFPAGQQCFARHQVPVGRPELFIVRDGDWRGNPRGTAARQHARPDDWVEEFADHQDRLAGLIEKG